MHVSFRLRKAIKYQGMVLAAFFLIACLGYSSIFLLEDPAKHGFEGEHSVAIMGGLGLVVFGSMLLMSIYVWAAYYVERFSIQRTVLSIRSMLQNHEFDVSELQCLHWKAHPMGGSVLFRVRGAKARLDLHGYSKEDRLGIVRALYDLVPANVQKGWPPFCHKVAIPLWDGSPPSAAIESPTEAVVTITRRRYDRMLAATLPIAVGLAIAIWWWLNLWQSFILPILVLAACLFLRFTVPAEGQTQLRLLSTYRGPAQLIGLGAVATSQLLMIALRLSGVEKQTACGAACVILVVAFPPMLYFLHKSDKTWQRAEERAAELAPAIWVQGEEAARSVINHGRI